MTYHEFHELMMPSVSQRLTNDLDGVVSAFHNNREQTPFQKLVRRIVAENAPPTKEIERIKKAFHRLDKDKSQTLTREELSLGVRRAGYVVSDDDLDRVFKELDTDGTGLVRYHEFVAGAIDHNILVGENLLRWVFDFMDDDDSNTITGDNLRVRAVCWGVLLAEAAAHPVGCLVSLVTVGCDCGDRVCRISSRWWTGARKRRGRSGRLRWTATASTMT